MNPAPCPKCGKAPVAIRVKSFWKVTCSEKHWPWRVEAHVMKTKTAAFAEWQRLYGAPAGVEKEGQ